MCSLQKKGAPNSEEAMPVINFRRFQGQYHSFAYKISNLGLVSIVSVLILNQDSEFGKNL